MGVVLREGDWRLEKRDEGFYEITYQEQPQEAISTPEHTSVPMGSLDVQTAGLPVNHVDSFQEAVGLFQERSQGQSPAGFGSISGGSSTGGLETGADRIGTGLDAIDQDLEDVSAEDWSLEAIAPALFVVGGAFLWGSGFAVDSLIFQIGAVWVAFGVLIVGAAVMMSDDLGEAVGILSTTMETESPPSEDDNPETTPPTPENLKNELYFDRADQKCEWCDEHIDQPEVHHIVQRSEGGSNDPSNLVVLCPNHHRQADAGAISRSKLKAKVRRQMGEAG